MYLLPLLMLLPALVHRATAGITDELSELANKVYDDLKVCEPGYTKVFNDYCMKTEALGAVVLICIILGILIILGIVKKLCC